MIKGLNVAEATHHNLENFERWTWGALEWTLNRTGYNRAAEMVAQN